ncbi:hypothetical protein HMPREF0021_01256 [Acinetobacter baumannii 6013150]|uniref:Uncharacterized protein n=1 Tax=Acinetobacter baumannii 6014059 TaxID=525242 RepID=A0A828SPD8_ACIBA|nr:hypothetical protein HMPREF0021_01256 [Acinetobacter baumannii 6013150]EGJ66158.1 hypothetical protein HMPREF0020_00251 [Acinetobacter baumannii 6013113]EGJ68192.1 hypothetical protein HMPREF0022_01946 [Acinetobacter baumannii 6014059]
MHSLKISWSGRAVVNPVNWCNHHQPVNKCHIVMNQYREVKP